MDFAIGDGQEQVLVSNLLVTTGLSWTGAGDVLIPMKIGGGQPLYARVQSSDASQQLQVLNATFHRGEPYRSFTCHRSQTYGVDTADSGGTQIDPGGVANTFSGWVEITPATIDPIRYLLVCLGGQNNATRSDSIHWYEVATGRASAEQTILAWQGFRQNASPDTVVPPIRGHHVSIPAGERLSIRQRSETIDATDRLVDFSIVGFGP
jgi:hypothetical protein